MATDDSWADARRIEAWAGEVRVNLFRLAALIAFYGHHLLTVYVFSDGPAASGPFNSAVTALVMAWAGAVVVLHLCLTRRWVPPALKFVSTGWDVLLVTVLLAVSAHPQANGGPGDARSLLAVLYFLVIASSPLRLTLPLVYAATLASMAGYICVLGYAKYVLQLPAELRPPRAGQITFLLALGAAGILAGQSVRQARRLAAGYPVSIVAEERPAAAQEQGSAS